LHGCETLIHPRLSVFLGSMRNRSLFGPKREIVTREQRNLQSDELHDPYC
jgi:hypothetical protein